MANTQTLTEALISRPSVTPHDAGCQDFIAEILAESGFECTALRFGEVDNLWAQHGHGAPTLVFAGHTDVVPTGPEDAWTSPPFSSTVRDGKLYGRGAADMKSSIAAMVIACQRFVKAHPQHPGTVAMLITSDEEGPAINGTAKAIEALHAQGKTFDYCVVGEPSCTAQLGDTVKIGRRGSLTGHLTLHGTQGHVAYPDLADNPIHKSLFALDALCKTTWDHGTDTFQPTTLQIANIHAGTGATNVIPGDLTVNFNLRYSPALTAQTLMSKTQTLLDTHALHHTLTWHHNAQPFYTTPSDFTAACAQAIQNVTGITPTFSTDGGTSDARFFAPTGCQVIEFGPCNGSIHQIDEHINLADLDPLSKVYYQIAEHTLSKA